MQCPSVDSNTDCECIHDDVNGSKVLADKRYNENLVMFVMGKRNRNYKEGSHNVRDMWGMGPVTEETWPGPWCMGVGQLRCRVGAEEHLQC